MTIEETSIYREFKKDVLDPLADSIADSVKSIKVSKRILERLKKSIQTVPYTPTITSSEIEEENTKYEELCNRLLKEFDIYLNLKSK